MNLNPFDLRGPEFLLVYALLIGATVYVVWRWGRWAEAGAPGEELGLAREISQDPYAIAFLRSGRFEVVHVAVVSLLEQRLLEADGKYLCTPDRDAVAKARCPLDKAILTRFQGPLLHVKTQADVIYTDKTIMAEADLYGETLVGKKLLPNDAARKNRRNLIMVAVAFLWLVAGIKIGVALSRGHSNILFLILLAAIAPIPLVMVSRRFRTALGDKTYRWAQELFSHLRNRRDSLGLNASGSELTFLAAVYGLALLPGAVSSVLDPLDLDPPSLKRAPWNANSGCGSSCASFSSGSSGSGSSCGGGGCGGGGGGCGGCGG